MLCITIGIYSIFIVIGIPSLIKLLRSDLDFHETCKKQTIGVMTFIMSFLALITILWALSICYIDPSMVNVICTGIVICLTIHGLLRIWTKTSFSNKMERILSVIQLVAQLTLVVSYFVWAIQQLIK